MRTLSEFRKEANDSFMIYDPIVCARPDTVWIDDIQDIRIDSFVKLEGTIKFGKGIHIASFAHLGIGGGHLVMGNYTAVASGGKIITGSNKSTGQSMSAIAPQDMQVVMRGCVVMEDYSVVLTNAVVMPDIILGEGAVLAAGAVLLDSIPPWEIWAGVPAVKIGDRNVEKFVSSNASFVQE